MEQTLAFFVLNNLRFRSAYNAVLQTSIGIEASGTSSADVDAIEVCLQHGFVGYLVTAELGVSTFSVSRGAAFVPLIPRRWL